MAWVTAMVQAPFLAQKLLHAMGMARKKNKEINKMENRDDDDDDENSKTGVPTMVQRVKDPELSL